jgi:hypothetical protein
LAEIQGIVWESLGSKCRDHRRTENDPAPCANRLLSFYPKGVVEPLIRMPVRPLPRSISEKDEAASRPPME